MDILLLKSLIHTKNFRILVLCGILYFLGFWIFRIWIEPDANKTPGQAGMFFRDVLWIFYWRWYLDWPIIIGFLGFGLLLMIIFNKLLHKISSRTLSTYLLPLILMGGNYLGMLAIDIAITWFADFYINGTWYSTEILFLGFTAQRLYHGFFFWFMPALLIIGIPLNSYIFHRKLVYFFKTLFVLMAGYSLCLGFLDPVVCEVIWNNWRAFGNWAMMGYDPMWAEGWITHYIIFAGLWLFGAWFIERTYQQILLLEKNKIT
jgi:hypothetical protein